MRGFVPNLVDVLETPSRVDAASEAMCEVVHVLFNHVGIMHSHDDSVWSIEEDYGT